MAVKNLVTGGAGFVGSHLVDLLLDKGESVLVLDDLSTGSLDNLAEVSGHSSLRFVKGSVLDKQAVQRTVDSVDRVFHLAAAVGVKTIVDDPIGTLQTNIRGTEIVLEAACARRLPILLTSTSEVYGRGCSVPFSEEDDLLFGPTTRARWCYGCSKAACEFLCLAYFRERHLPCVIARLFNTVGPRQTGRYGMVLPRFVRQVRDGGPVTVYGDGEQTRCFAHVADVVSALDTLCGSQTAAGGVFNVGNDEEVSIADLAERVKALAGSDVAIVHIPYEQVYGEGFDDILRRVPDLTKIRAEMNYAPKKKLDEIVGELLKVDRKLGAKT